MSRRPKGPQLYRPLPPNEIPLHEVDHIHEINTVVRRWIDAPHQVGVDVEKLSDTSIEDLLVLCAVVRPQADTLEIWQELYFGLSPFDEDEDETIRARSARLRKLMQQASKWLDAGLRADDDRRSGGIDSPLAIVR